jgi:Flp pilus assembly protein TadG
MNEMINVMMSSLVLPLGEMRCFVPTVTEARACRIRQDQCRGGVMPINRIAPPGRGCRGGAAIEFALVLPLLLLLVFATIEFSLALYDKAVITNAAREAARAGVVVRTTRLTNDQIEVRALSYASNRLISFGSSTPTVTVNNGGGVSGANLTVTVNYTFHGLGLGPMLSALAGPIVLSSTATMINE